MSDNIRRRKRVRRESGQSSSNDSMIVRRRRGILPVGSNFSDTDTLGQPLPDYVDFGDCDNICPFCHALFWKSERVTNHTRYNRCCKGGSAVLSIPPYPPQLLLDLFRDRIFKENIRAYNMMFSMTSFGASIDDSLNNGGGPYVFRVNGQISHHLGSLCPQSTDSPRFLQLYIHDTDNEIANRMTNFRSQSMPELSTDIVRSLSRLLHNTNALVRTFKTAHETALTLRIEDYAVRLYAHSADRRYSLPTPGSLGAIVFGEDERSNEYDIVVHSKSGQPRRVSKLHQSYMPLQYPLLFPFGETGWFPSMKVSNADGSTDRSVSITTFYCNQLHDRSGVISLILMAGKLLQQYMVDAYLCIEHSRLEFFRLNQAKFRKEFVAGIHDAIARGDTDGRSVGQRMLLPSSFVGGPRYMYQHYQDALAICRVHGNPQYFITFTCNVSWPEISRFTAAQQLGGAQNRPDIVARVFRIKVAELVSFLKKDKTFGDVSAHLYTIEFQKRGLPHCHMLLWVTSEHRIKTPADVDRYICAELPDPELQPLLYSVVTTSMVHGPCGVFNPTSLCMRNGKCKFSFPKPFSVNTSIDNNGYVRYKRGSTQSHTQNNGVRVHNDFVVPYNARLLSRFRAHINVEYCGWNMMVKYLFKYISKGADRITFSVQRNTSCASTSQRANVTAVNEIQRFVDGRFICPHEAAWRIFKFPIHERHPAVQILAVHLPNMQTATFTDSTALTNLVNQSDFGATTLTEWFKCNQLNAEGRQLTYADYPTLFWWNVRSKKWITRASFTKGTIGRLIYVSPTAGELFYLRMLLCHQKGCTSFDSLKRVSGVNYSTFFLACEALGLIGDDREWLSAFNEASSWASASQLRSLFCNLLMFCDVSNAMILWEEGWRRMTDDLSYALCASKSIDSIHVTDDLLQQQLLIELQVIFESASPPRSLSEFRLPQPNSSSTSFLRNRLLSEESNYNRPLLSKQNSDMLSKLNEDQLLIYNRVVNDYPNKKQTLLFIYGHGGTGKTFLWSTILSYFRSLGKIALAVAGSGIASLLLPAGRTAHSRFHIPLKISSRATCGIAKRTQMADLLGATDLIIWDEATMTDRLCFECVDKSFRDVLDQPNLPFGGISVLFGGDFRQTLPVKPKKNPADIIASTLPNSYLWPLFKVCYLRHNMRLSSLSSESITFASWLLAIGNGDTGILGNNDAETAEKKIVRIPDRLLILNSDDPLHDLISFVYPPEVLLHPTPTSLSSRAIVCPKNNTTQEINTRVLTMTPGISKFYKSVDSVQSRTNRHIDLDLLYPQDYLNQLQFSGFPVSNLELKTKTPVILLRNINIREGLCNGTRLMVSKLLSHLIEADIITGTAIGTKVIIPRIKFVHDGDDIPFVFIRKQFPLRVCYAMTINKSQGQSLQRVGIYLPHPVFGHGQLYVALSRAISVESIKLLLLDDKGHPAKTTFNIVFKDLLAAIETVKVIYTVFLKKFKT